VGPISVALGAVIDFIYNLVIAITPVGALGFSIIIMTIIIRSALLPTAFKMQRNMMKTRAMKPEMDKIKEKYGDTKDPEMRRKMSAEMQALQSKHGVNMLASCLPMLITWPLFMALFVVLGQAFLFIGSVGDAYSAISFEIIAQGGEFLRTVVTPMVDHAVPAGMSINLNTVEDMNRAIHVLSAENWATLFSYFSGEQLANIQNLYNQKMSVLSFFGLNLIEPAGWGWPGIILPVLSAGTMFLAQFLMMRANPPTDPQQQNIQRITMILFPLMFGAFTITAAAGVGLYWVMLNVYLIVQQHFIHKYYVKKDEQNESGAKAKA
jgi:YidC/Oxa1 family membrane protein insertase